MQNYWSEQNSQWNQNCFSSIIFPVKYWVDVIFSISEMNHQRENAISYFVKLTHSIRQRADKLLWITSKKFQQESWKKSCKFVWDASRHKDQWWEKLNLWCVWVRLQYQILLCIWRTRSRLRWCTTIPSIGSTETSKIWEFLAFHSNYQSC